MNERLAAILRLIAVDTIHFLGEHSDDERLANASNLQIGNQTFIIIE